MVELVRAGRAPEELAEEFEPTARSIRNRVAQAGRDEGRCADGLTSAQKDEPARLRRKVGQLSSLSFSRRRTSVGTRDQGCPHPAGVRHHAARAHRDVRHRSWRSSLPDRQRRADRFVGPLARVGAGTQARPCHPLGRNRRSPAVRTTCVTLGSRSGSTPAYRPLRLRDGPGTVLTCCSRSTPVALTATRASLTNG